MAKTTEGVPAEPRPQPNIDAIVALLAPNGPIEKGEKAQADGLSAVGKHYQRVEKDFQGNRGAVSFIRRMMKMGDDKRADFIRTMEPLLVHYGYTLDDIDPDLVDQSAAKKAAEDGEGDDDDDDQAGANAAASPLDAARARMTQPVTDPIAQDRAAAANGSVQLRKFIGALRAGRDEDEAIKISGIPAGEAKAHVAAETKGEYANMDAIAPAPKRGKPKLGIVTPGTETPAPGTPDGSADDIA